MSTQDASFKDFVALVPKNADSQEFAAVCEFVAVYRLQPVEKQKEEDATERTPVAKRAQVKLRTPVLPIGGAPLKKKKKKKSKKQQEKRKKDASDDDDVAEDEKPKKKQKKNK